MQSTFRKCADSGKQDGQDGQAENVAQGWRRLRAIEGSRCERERGAGKKLPASTSEMRTEGTSRLHLLACSPLTHSLMTDPKKAPLQSCASS